MLNSMKVHFRLIGKIKIKRKGKTPIDCFVFNYLGQVCTQLEDSFSFLDFVQLYIFCRKPLVNRKKNWENTNPSGKLNKIFMKLCGNH